MKTQLKYDYSLMFDEAIGDNGISDTEIDQTLEKIINIRNLNFKDKTTLGFMKLPYDAELVSVINEKVNKYRLRFDTLLVLGIGGSDLGARAVIAALGGMYRNWDASVRASQD
ncbi:MAG: hypothetical protein M3P33_02290, partial [bacterium]|nr:hypothetical protein [bacterium]